MTEPTSQARNAGAVSIDSLREAVETLYLNNIVPKMEKAEEDLLAAITELEHLRAEKAGLKVEDCSPLYAYQVRMERDALRAERDALKEQVEADNKTMAADERKFNEDRLTIDSLRAELEGLRERVVVQYAAVLAEQEQQETLIAERDSLRAEMEGLRKRISDYPPGVSGIEVYQAFNELDSLRADLAAATKAKEEAEEDYLSLESQRRKQVVELVAERSRAEAMAARVEALENALRQYAANANFVVSDRVKCLAENALSSTPAAGGSKEDK